MPSFFQGIFRAFSSILRAFTPKRLDQIALPAGDALQALKAPIDPAELSSWNEKFAPGQNLYGDRGNLPVLSPMIQALQQLGMVPKGGASGDPGDVMSMVREAKGYNNPFDYLAQQMLGKWRAEHAGLDDSGLSKSRALTIPEPTGAPKGIYWSPIGAGQQIGYRERNGLLSYSDETRTAGRCALIPPVEQLTVKQHAMFLRPYTREDVPGFRVRLADPTAHMTVADKREATRIVEMITAPVGGDDFLTRGSKLMQQSIRHDQSAFEKLLDRAGRPVRWNALDATDFRLAYMRELYPSDDIDAPFAVQLIDGMPAVAFTRRNLGWWVRNPRPTRDGFGYGVSEVEMAMAAIYAFLSGWDFNQNAFTHGNLQTCLLNLKGFIPEDRFQEFRDNFGLMTTGALGGWRTPILNHQEGVEVINFNKSNKDMEFSGWMDFGVNVVYGTYNRDRAELGQKFGQAGGGNSQIDGGNKSKVIESKARALAPILTSWDSCITNELVIPHNSDFVWESVGLETNTPKEKADLITQYVRSVLTIDEGRKMLGHGPHPAGKQVGSMTLDSNFVANMTRLEMRADQEQAKLDAQVLENTELAAIIAMDHGGMLGPQEIGKLAELLHGDAAAGGPPSGAPPKGPKALPPGPPNGAAPGGGSLGKSLALSDIERSIKEAREELNRVLGGGN